MWIVRLALQRPYSVITFCLVMVILGALALRKMRVDILPAIDIPVVIIVWNYPGLSAEDMETRVVYVTERALSTTVDGISRIESQSIEGVGIVKTYFQPGTDIGGAIAQISATTNTITRVLPPGMTPPFVLRFNASNVPVAQLTISGQGVTEQELYDYGLNFLRLRLFTIPGLSTPAPYGGRTRQVMVDIDPAKLAAAGLSPQDIVNTISAQNVILPAGTARIADTEYDVALNSSPPTVPEFNQIPVKEVNGRPVLLGEVAHVYDGYAEQTNIVRVNNRRATYLSIMKKATASTLEVVDSIKKMLPSLQAAAPKGVNLRLDFDQSVFVRAAVVRVLHEALMHAVLVQVLCGNAAVAKTPSEGGLHALTVCAALARRAGLPVSLISGSGGALSSALVRNPQVACVSFVGGRATGRDVAANLHDRTRRFMLEMEGVNAWGIWRFSDWDGLARHLRKGFEYGKQRCTAYPRFVVQRGLVPRFLEVYLPVLASLRIGHPLLARTPADRAPDVDFGPLIGRRHVEELESKVAEAEARGAVPLYKGQLDPANFLPGQDTSAYLPPMALLNVPRGCALYHAEPFGPVDSVVVVDTEEQLLEEMNVSGGALVASLSCDGPSTAQRIARQVQAFKVGLNAPRSRGDQEELFGGLGASWRGCFVGGHLLAQAVTVGEPAERLPGNFDDGVVLPLTPSSTDEPLELGLGGLALPGHGNGHRL